MQEQEFEWEFEDYINAEYDKRLKDGDLQTQHFSIILLKSKDGKSVQSVYNKPGSEPPSVTNKSPAPFLISPVKGASSAFFKIP
jgi:hypothetical protein